MNHWPLTLARQQRRENTCRSHLTTGGPGKDQGTHKLPPTKILERSKRDGRLQSRGPTNFPGFFSLESISAERWVCPQEGCQFRMAGKRQARKEPNDHKTWDCEVLSVSLWQSSSLRFAHPPAPLRTPGELTGAALPQGRWTPLPACTTTSRTGPRASLLLPGETPETPADPPHRDNPSFLSAHLSIIQGSNYDYRKERWPDLGRPWYSIEPEKIGYNETVFFLETVKVVLLHMQLFKTIASYKGLPRAMHEGNLSRSWETSLVAQAVKLSTYSAGDLGSIPGSGRSPGEGNGILAHPHPPTTTPTL